MISGRRSQQKIRMLAGPRDSRKGWLQVGWGIAAGSGCFLLDRQTGAYVVITTQAPTQRSELEDTGVYI